MNLAGPAAFAKFAACPRRISGFRHLILSGARLSFDRAQDEARESKDEAELQYGPRK